MSYHVNTAPRSVSPEKLRAPLRRGQGQTELRGPARRTEIGSALEPSAPAARPGCPLGSFSPGGLHRELGFRLQRLRQARPRAAHNGPFDSTGLGSFRKSPFPATAPVTEANVPTSSGPHRASVQQRNKSRARRPAEPARQGGRTSGKMEDGVARSGGPFHQQSH